jgi:hypothetical protein
MYKIRATNLEPDPDPDPHQYFGPLPETHKMISLCNSEPRTVYQYFYYMVFQDVKNVNKEFS